MVDDDYYRFRELGRPTGFSFNLFHGSTLFQRLRPLIFRELSTVLFFLRRRLQSHNESYQPSFGLDWLIGFCLVSHAESIYLLASSTSASKQQLDDLLRKMIQRLELDTGSISN